MPSKTYLLQLGESALLAGLIAAMPLLNGQQPNWYMVGAVFAFAVGHSLTKHIKNADQRQNVDALLTATQQLMPSIDDKPTRYDMQAVKPPPQQ